MVYNNDFLQQLDTQKNKVIYAKITSLSWDELPVETIQGKVTSGSVNIDGASAIRRTCSLSLIAEDLNIQEYYWGEKTKFLLEIGVSNAVNNLYPDIIWFSQGIFVITSFSTSFSFNGYTVSIQGKDKMCLLNGDVGGSFGSSIDFGTIEEIDANNVTHITHLPIKEIIKQAVHVYGNEYFHNIIINDLDEDGLELLEYRLDNPMFLLRNIESKQFRISVFDVETPCWCLYERDNDGDGVYETIELSESMTLGDITNEDNYFRNELINYDPLISLTEEGVKPSIIGFTFDNNDKPIYSGKKEDLYYAAFIKYGDTAGYRLTELTYPKDLIAAAGESVTSVLDKITGMLGNYEYFYNLEGKFVFQKKPNQINTPFNTTVNGQTYIDNIVDPYAYYFKGAELISGFNNSPNLLNIKNDFSVWGVRQSISGAELPVHMRYAIDIKPYCYTTIDGITYTTLSEGELVYNEEDLNTDFATNGYPRQNVHPILGADWWEVRDWANAWQWLGLSIPDQDLGTYCIKQAVLYKEGTTNYPTTGWYGEVIPIEISAEDWTTLGLPGTYLRTEDIIFKSDGTYWDYHGKCSHSYTEWLDYFLPGGRYAGGTAYFYVPQVPAEAIPDPEKPNEIVVKYNVDWREIIYRMAKDYFKYAHILDDFELRIIKNNKPWRLYLSGKTEYEQYYTDIIGFWRQLYNPDIFTKVIPSGILGIDHLSEDFYLGEPSNDESLPFEKNHFNYCDPEDYPEDNTKWYWAKNVYDSPDMLNFWFDFLDINEGELNHYSNKAIGNRLKAVTDNNVKGIYFKDTPEIIFMTDEDFESDLKLRSGYRYFIAPKIDNMFSISARGRSAKDKIDELLNAHSFLNETVTINTIPIYYLQPNTVIQVSDIKTKIDGDYIINKLSIPLGHDKTMSITASKVIRNLM